MGPEPERAEQWDEIAVSATVAQHKGDSVASADSAGRIHS
jgi:hypothetical protein